MCGRSAQAQDLLVLEASEQDHLAADKLQSLIKEPCARLGAEDLEGRDLSRGLGCTTEAKYELILDSAHDAVRLVRCQDGTVMTRAIDPQAARQTPYLAAFIAAELLSLNAELERVVLEPGAARERGGVEPRTTPPERVSPSATSPSSEAPAADEGPASPPPAPRLLVCRGRASGSAWRSRRSRPGFRG